MKYNYEEKQIAQDFINCKIPDSIKNNKHNLNFDTMEFYELLFDFAHCVLDDVSLTSNFSSLLVIEEFGVLKKQLNPNGVEQKFFDNANRLLEIITRHVEI